ncbi:hypothetical protein VNI00_005987 [Paramarasmius palmivorus]|uniref:Uncharacterized protein n=1 Tax=Paramarasmius palmivorus TaxID=297713 RepID=A0AAW0DD57_9AGAR
MMLPDLASRLIAKAHFWLWLKTAFYVGTFAVGWIAVIIQGASYSLQSNESRIENIAALVLLILALLILLTTLRWPTQVKVAFTFLVLLSRSLSYISRVVDITNLSHQTSHTTSDQRLKLRLETLELVLSLFLLGGFAGYTSIHWNRLTTGTLWTYHVVSALFFFGIEIPLQVSRNSTFIYVFSVFLSFTLLLLIIWDGLLVIDAQVSYRNALRLKPPRPTVGRRLIPLSLRPVKGPLEIEAATSSVFVDKAREATLSQSRSSISLSHSSTAPSSNIVAPDFGVASSIDLAPESSPQTLSSPSRSLREVAIPSTAPPSFHSREPDRAGPSGALDRNQTLSSVSSYTTLPSYHSRRSSHVFPPSAVRALPPLPPLVLVTAPNQDGDRFPGH